MIEELKDVMREAYAAGTTYWEHKGEHTNSFENWFAQWSADKEITYPLTPREILTMVEEFFPIAEMPEDFKGAHSLYMEDGQLIVNVWHNRLCTPSHFQSEKDEHDQQQLRDYLENRKRAWDREALAQKTAQDQFRGNKNVEAKLNIVKMLVEGDEKKFDGWFVRDVIKFLLEQSGKYVEVEG